MLLAFLLPAAAIAQGSAPVHPAKETILLKEDFDGQPRITVPEYNYGDTAFANVRDGHYVLDAKKAGRFWALRLQTPAEFVARTTVLEMRMKMTADAASGQYGILWHTIRTAPNVFNEYVFTITSSGKFAVYAKLEDKPYPVIGWTPCDCISKGNDAYNTLRIEEWEKGRYRFFINEQMVYEGDLMIPTFTTFGFYSDAHTVLYVDYVKFAARE